MCFGYVFMLFWVQWLNHLTSFKSAVEETYISEGLFKRG